MNIIERILLKIKALKILIEPCHLEVIKSVKPDFTTQWTINECDKTTELFLQFSESEDLTNCIEENYDLFWETNRSLNHIFETLRDNYITVKKQTAQDIYQTIQELNQQIDLYNNYVQKTQQGELNDEIDYMGFILEDMHLKLKRLTQLAERQNLIKTMKLIYNLNQQLDILTVDPTHFNTQKSQFSKQAQDIATTALNIAGRTALAMDFSYQNQTLADWRDIEGANAEVPSPCSKISRLNHSF